MVPTETVDWGEQAARGWPYVSRRKHRAAGFLFAPDGSLFTGKALFDYFCPGGILPLPEVFLSRLNRANGFFAVVLQEDDKLFAAVDRLRSLPLFWRKDASGIRFGPNAQALLAPGTQAHTQIDPLQALFFRRTGHTDASATLWPEVHQIPAGHALIQADNKDLEQVCWFSHHRMGALEAIRTEDAFPMLDAAADRLTDRLTTLAGGKPIAVSLSGGLDSRLVLALLVRAGYPQLLTFTYGRADSPDARTARQTAEQLSVPWHFIDYGQEDFGSWFDGNGHAYQQYAFRGASLPFEQDFFALRILKEKMLLPPETLIVNGHSGDVITGKKIPPAATLRRYAHTREGLSQWLYDRYLAPKTRKEKPEIRLQLLAAIERGIDSDTAISDQNQWIAAHESWKTRHETAQYIINSQRAYEWFGWKWHLPLYDAEWLQLWYDLPDEHRIDQRLYRQWLVEQVFGPLGLNSESGGFDRHLGHDNATRRLRNLLPKPARRLLKNLILPASQTDPNRLLPLAHRLQCELQVPVALEEGINRVYAAWFLENMNRFESSE